MRGFAGLLLLTLAGGGAPIERPHTEEALEVKCVMRGGCWHRDDLMGGFCEFQAPGLP
jgi:hypothetical protein